MLVAVGTTKTPVRWVKLRDWGYGDDLNNIIDSALVDSFADASFFDYEDAKNLVVPRLETLLDTKFTIYGVEE